MNKLFASKHSDALYSCSVLRPEATHFWEGSISDLPARPNHCSKATIPSEALRLLTNSHSGISNIFPAISIVMQQAGTSKVRAPVSLGTLGCTTAVLQQAEIFCGGYYTLRKIQTKALGWWHYWETLTVR